MSDKSILVVDDDKKIRALLRNVLVEEGFCVTEAETSAEALRMVAETKFALLTLDLQLGNDSGLEVAREIRRFSTVPIIMVTGKDDVIDRVVGLEIGADDYITKPFHIREVVARIRSVLRRAGELDATEESAPTDVAVPVMSPNPRYLFDGLIASPERLELLDRDGEDCGLTSGDFRLLRVFLERPKRVLSRDQLMDLTGGQSWSPLDRTIDNQVARLRKKIERDPSNPKIIKSVRGVGYSLACDVRIAQPPDGAVKSA